MTSHDIVGRTIQNPEQLKTISRSITSPEAHTSRSFTFPDEFFDATKNNLFYPAGMDGIVFDLQSRQAFTNGSLDSGGSRTEDLPSIATTGDLTRATILTDIDARVVLAGSQDGIHVPGGVATTISIQRVPSFSVFPNWSGRVANVLDISITFGVMVTFSNTGHGDRALAPALFTRPNAQWTRVALDSDNTITKAEAAGTPDDWHIVPMTVPYEDTVDIPSPGVTTRLRENVYQDEPWHRTHHLSEPVTLVLTCDPDPVLVRIQGTNWPYATGTLVRPVIDDPSTMAGILVRPGKPAIIKAHNRYALTRVMFSHDINQAVSNTTSVTAALTAPIGG